MSAQCMYSMIQVRAWSIPHTPSGLLICSVEEEEVKITCDKADSRDAELGFDHVEVLEEVN
jgi:hypothetical protein